MAGCRASSGMGRRVWRRSRMPAVLSGFGCAFIGIGGSCLAAFGVALARAPGGFWLALLALAASGVMVALAAYVWRDMRGRPAAPSSWRTTASRSTSPAGGP